MKIRFTIIILILLVSCKTNLPSRFYESPDSVTGGFYNFSLDLRTNGTLDLDIKILEQIKQSESGVEWESNGFKITGKWSIYKKTYRYILDKPDTYIDSILKISDFNFNYMKKPVITFSVKLDTAYIYGIPCVINEDTLKNGNPVRKGY